MNKREKEIVRQHIRDIYNEWHQCEIGTARNPLTAAMQKAGVKRGQLCDVCEAIIDDRVKQIEEEIKER